jgi:choline dehydrogenase-like flavoprotein
VGEPSVCGIAHFANGIPAPTITYRLSENSRRMLDHAIERGGETLRTAGAYDLWHEARIPEGGWHLMGTEGIGTDPARSVVNEWGRSLEVKDPSIVDVSIFVTAAGVNPTRTMQALALYVANSIKQQLAALFD